MPLAGPPLCRLWARVAIAAALAAAGCGGAPEHVVVERASPDGQLSAEVRLTRCGGAWCHSLWVGAAGAAAHVATLARPGERAGEIAWSHDGARVAFLVDGVQLRLFDARTRAPAGQLDLVAADGPPTRRIARGVTFSETGAAVTFDDCPRDRSGCRPGMVALR